MDEPAMDVNDFCNDLQKSDLSYIASKWLIEKLPFIFDNNFEDYICWKEKLSSYIGVDSKAISIIGSACVGFSLNPNKKFKSYNESSDIDVAIISHYYFDFAWHELRNLGAKRYGLKRAQRNSVEEHVNRYIYWGTIATDRILPILSFGKDWTIGLSEMSKIQPSTNKEINLRIYNDFESLRAYHINNLIKLRDQIFEGALNE